MDGSASICAVIAGRSINRYSDNDNAGISCSHWLHSGFKGQIRESNTQIVLKSGKTVIPDNTIQLVKRNTIALKDSHCFSLKFTRFYDIYPMKVHSQRQVSLSHIFV
jgi:hypothetical protein